MEKKPQEDKRIGQTDLEIRVEVMEGGSATVNIDGEEKAICQRGTSRLFGRPVEKPVKKGSYILRGPMEVLATKFCRGARWLLPDRRKLILVLRGDSNGGMVMVNATFSDGYASHDRSWVEGQIRSSRTMHPEVPITVFRCEVLPY